MDSGADISRSTKFLQKTMPDKLYNMPLKEAHCSLFKRLDLLENEL
jgi:hypothetical protein